MRQFNPQKDKYYSMDNTPDLYLTTEQVNDALNKIKIRNDEMEQSAVELLKKSVNIHMEKGLGKLTGDEESNEIQNLEKDFVSKFGIWPYQTEVYTDFYNLFSGE